MGRPNNGDTNVAAGPSIALLQERFRQLEKARQLRDHERTLKLFPEPKGMISSTKNNIPHAKQGLQHEMVILPSEKDQLSLGLSLNNSNRTGFRAMKTRNIWSGFSPKRKFDNSEVDTSLHL